MTYTSLKVEIRTSKISEKGVFSKEKIKKGELVFDFSGGGGKFYSSKERQFLEKQWRELDIQVDDDLFWGATNDSEMEIGDYLNHSCDPSCGMGGALQIVAMRDIEPNEEITLDYAMSESHSFDIECNCRNPLCRGIITGEDWKKKELQERYRGYFSPYLQEKIEAGLKP